MTHQLKPRDPKARRTRFELLRDWYGEEAARTEIAAHTDPGEWLSNVVERYVDELNHDEIGDYVRLTSRWENYCGEALVRWLVPAGIRDGVLSVEIPHSGLAAMITPSLELIRNKINQEFGADFCRSIRLVPGAGARAQRRTRRHQE